jgi:soluble lytic murein transglycosylase-like protein
LAQHGGPFAALDPLTNLRIGVRHLQALVQQTDTLEEALALYGAASGQPSDSPYVERVLAEQQQLLSLTAPASPPSAVSNSSKLPAPAR